MLQTNYLTQTSEILIQKTSNIVLQKKNHFKSSGQIVCPWHKFFLLHLTLKTLYVRKKTATTWHFGYCVKSKFAVCLSAHGVTLRQLTCQNMLMEKAGA